MGRGLFFGLEIDIWCFLSHHQNIQVQELRDRNKRSSSHYWGFSGGASGKESTCQ